MTVLDRRQMVAGTAAALLVPAAARAAAVPSSAAQKTIRTAIDRQLPENFARIQDWIRHPGIAAENWQMQSVCAYTMGLLRNAGFQTVKRLPTKGQPGISVTFDAGAARTVGIYFMYDVKQVNPAEWSSPPFEARITDKPGWGKVIVGRGAINQKGPEAAFLAALNAFRAAGQEAATLYPRSAGSWPGSVFTQPPVSLPAGQFGLGHGSGAHAPNEDFVIESTNPAVQGLAGCTAGFVDLLYEMATTA